MSYTKIKPSAVAAAIDFSEFADDVLIAAMNNWQEAIILLMHWINNSEPDWEYSPSYMSLLMYVSRSEQLLQHLAKILFTNKEDYDTWTASHERLRVIDGKVTPPPFD